MKYMHIVSFTYIILTLGIIIGFVGLLPSTHDLTGSFFSSSSYLSAFAQKPPITTGQEQHLSAFAQTPSSTNRVTAGQQQSSFPQDQDQGQTSSPLPFLPFSNQSTNAQIPSSTTASVR
jgi:hypothetical protein